MKSIKHALAPMNAATLLINVNANRTDVTSTIIANNFNRLILISKEASTRTCIAWIGSREEEAESFR